MLKAGEVGNTTYLDRTEARQTMFTQVVTGLEFLEEQRLGRPVGTFDAPHPERAEAVASGRSLANIRVSWAEVGGPAFLAAGKAGDAFLLHGLSAQGQNLFSLGLSSP